jgi:hypothetical protein
MIFRTEGKRVHCPCKDTEKMAAAGMILEASGVMPTEQLKNAEKNGGGGMPEKVA